MRLADLLVPEQPLKLRHPDLGSVLWTNVAGQGFALVWAEGREKGWPLIADESVLLNDRWSAEAGEAQPVPRSSRGVIPKSADLVPNPAAIASRRELAQYVEQLRSNPLDDPEVWKQSAGKLLHHLREALLCVADFRPEDRGGLSADTPNWPLFAWLMGEARVLLLLSEKPSDLTNARQGNDDVVSDALS